MTSSPLDFLRPKPFRGDVIAAGVVVLATLVVIVMLRFATVWQPETHLAYATVAFAFVAMMALLAELEGEHPRAYQSVLYVASVVLLIVALIALARALGDRGWPGGLGSRVSGEVAWIAAVVTMFSSGFAIGRNSAVCALLAAIAGGVAVLFGVDWLWDPGSVGTFRWILVALVCCYGVGAIGARDRHPRHGVAFIDAAGLAVVLISLSFANLTYGGETIAGAGDVDTGWELLIVAAGFGLIAYSSVDRQPGPAYLGVVNLLLFAVISSLGAADESATLLGWPLALALAAAGLLAIGLRPTTPAPPPPDIDAPESPPLPLR